MIIAAASLIVKRQEYNCDSRVLDKFMDGGLFPVIGGDIKPLNRLSPG